MFRTVTLLFIIFSLLINLCSSLTRNVHKGGLIHLRTPASSIICYNVAESSDGALDTFILRRVDKWACVKNCGACCKLGPLDSRPDLESYLTGEYKF